MRKKAKKCLAVFHGGHTNGIVVYKICDAVRITLAVLAVALAAPNSGAQILGPPVNAFPTVNRDPLAVRPDPQQAAVALAAYERQEQIVAARQRELAEIYAKDPWRKIGNSTNRAYGTGWVEFQGIVQEARTNGAVFKGAWGQVLAIQPWRAPSGQLDNGRIQYGTIYGDSLFFVDDFPYPATGGQIYADMLARAGGYFSYTNADGQLVKLPRLIYGTPCVKIWSPEEIAAAQEKVDAQKQAVEDRVLVNNLMLAYEGDPYGLLRMGERYRDGEGVPKDLAKARDYLSQAADAGSPEAGAELSELNAATNAPAAR